MTFGSKVKNTIVVALKTTGKRDKKLKCTLRDNKTHIKSRQNHLRNKKNILKLKLKVPS